MSKYNSRRISDADITNPSGRATPASRRAATASAKNIKCDLEFLDSEGKPIDGKDTSKIFAKVITTGRKASYHILVNRDSLPFDVTDRFYLETSLRTAKLMSVEPFRLLEVTKNAYDHYKNFLQTKNKNFYNYASRLQ